MKTQKIIASLMTSVILIGVSAPIFVKADSTVNSYNVTETTTSLQDVSLIAPLNSIVTGEVEISNADILNNIKQNNPEAYNQIPKSVISTLLRADLMRTGSTRMAWNSGGFTIYLDSTTANWAKTAGAIGIAGIFAAIGSTAGTPLMGGITGAAGAALGLAIGSWNVSRGIWVSYNWIGIMTGHGNQ